MSNFINRDVAINIVKNATSLKEALLDLRQAPTVEMEKNTHKARKTGKDYR